MLICAAMATSCFQHNSRVICNTKIFVLLSYVLTLFLYVLYCYVYLLLCSFSVCVYSIEQGSL